MKSDKIKDQLQIDWKETNRTNESNDQKYEKRYENCLHSVGFIAQVLEVINSLSH